MERPSIRTAIGLALVLSACGADSPTSPGSGAPPEAPAARQYTLSGTVRAGGLPVAGARVAALRGNEATAAVETDGSGSYRHLSVENVSFSGALVSVSKAGYFTDTAYISMVGDRTVDFDLEPASSITLNQVVHADLGAARCASLGYGGEGGAPCRRLAVTVPSAGLLEVTLSVAPVLEFDVSILRPDGTIALYRSIPRASTDVDLQTPVEAGLTYQIDVAVWGAATEFAIVARVR